MDFSPTENQIMIAETIRKFGETHMHHQPHTPKRGRKSMKAWIGHQPESNQEKRYRHDDHADWPDFLYAVGEEEKHDNPHPCV